MEKYKTCGDCGDELKDDRNCVAGGTHSKQLLTPQSVQKEEIRKAFHTAYIKGELQIDFTGDGVPFKSVDDFLDSIVDRISASVREETVKMCVDVLPDEKHKDHYKGSGSEYLEGEHDGFNDCRSQILSALQKLSD